MANRAECNQVAPPDDGPAKLLRRLLNIELERLEVAVRIEKERKIVFPETSVIIRDIERLSALLERGQNKDSRSLGELLRDGISLDGDF